MSIRVLLRCMLFLAVPLANAESIQGTLTFPITSGSADMSVYLTDTATGWFIGDAELTFSLFGPGVSLSGYAHDGDFGGFPGVPFTADLLEYWSKGENETVSWTIAVGSVSGSFYADDVAPGFTSLAFSSIILPNLNGGPSTATGPFTVSTRSFWPGFLNDYEVDMNGRGTQTFSFDPNNQGPSSPDTIHFEFTSIPEPGTWILTSLALTEVGCVLYRRKRKDYHLISKPNNS
jgi:hypothetical protein